MILLGAAPMAAARASRAADPILAESIAGPSSQLNYPAPPFRLTGQSYAIDRAGHVRQVLSTEAGPATAATRASFASLLAGAAQQALRSP